MSVRHVYGAGPKPDLFCSGRYPGEERDRGGDVLGLVGYVFANIGFGKPEFVRQQESLAVFAQ